MSSNKTVARYGSVQGSISAIIEDVAETMIVPLDRVRILYRPDIVTMWIVFRPVCVDLDPSSNRLKMGSQILFNWYSGQRQRLGVNGNVNELRFGAI